MKIASLLSAALITLPLALFAASNPFDDVNLKGSTDKANPVGYKIGEPIVFTLRTENLAEVPLSAERKEVATVGGCKVYAVSIACAGPRPATGYLYIPEGAAKKSCGARVAFQGYGAYLQARPDWAAGPCVANREIFLEINAHGYSGGNKGVRGAGGSINVTAGALAGSGAIHANGLSGESGGRVSVRLTNSGATFDDFEGTIMARRDGESRTAPGTVYLQTVANGEGGGTIIVDGSLRSGTASSVATPYTPIPANGAHADDPSDLKKCSLKVSNYARIGIAETLQLESLETDSSSVIDLNGKTLTVKSAKIGNTNLKRGTYAGGSTVAIGDGSLSDYLVDSATGGSLVVNSYGPILLIIPR